MAIPESRKEITRRTFLGAIATAVPTIQLLGSEQAAQGAEAAGSPSDPDQSFRSEKFTPVNMTPFFNCSPADFGHRAIAPNLWMATRAGRGWCALPRAGRVCVEFLSFWLRGMGPEGLDGVERAEQALGNAHHRDSLEWAGGFLCIAYSATGMRA